ncbi:hypothetical protein VNO77_23961 [Canavalia gladiata]|uniref:Uncharacterized protein n=1 Tax=Canavalia gladiata TaxID=3824 RepID=A0AAN9L7V7_CANGL
MYSSASQFDGNAAFSGGGFMPTQTTQGPDSSFFPSKNRDAQSLLPLTVKQINDAFQSSDDKTNLIIDGVDVNNITLVGRICNKAGRITDVTFVLDDGTGRIDCNKWLQEAADTNEAEGIMDGMYVRLHGHLKGFQGKRTLNVFSFRPVTDFNEIASHFIDCIYVHLYNSRLRIGVPNQQYVTNSAPITPTKGYQAQAVPPNQFSGQHINGQKSVEDMVLDVLHLPTNRTRDEGVPRDLIAQHIGISLDKLMLAIKNLIEEGAIYEAIADHYKSIINEGCKLESASGKVTIALASRVFFTPADQHHFHRPLRLVPEMARGNRVFVAKSRAVVVDHFSLTVDLKTPRAILFLIESLYDTFFCQPSRQVSACSGVNVSFRERATIFLA